MTALETIQVVLEDDENDRVMRSLYPVKDHNQRDQYSSLVTPRQKNLNTIKLLQKRETSSSIFGPFVSFGKGSRDAFKIKFKTALRITLAIFATSFLSVHAPNDPTNSLIFPSGYYLGGAGVAIFAVYGSGPTLGCSIERSFQIKLGTIVATVFCYLLFLLIPPTHQHLIPLHDTDNSITSSSSTPHYVSLMNLAIFLPLLNIYLFLVYMTPTDILFKKFAVVTTLFFFLVMINPMSLVDPLTLKSPSTRTEDSHQSIVKNLVLNSAIGTLGFVFTLVGLVLPTPILALKKLKNFLTHHLIVDIKDVLETMVDGFWFRQHPIIEMQFVHSKLVRKLELMQERHTKMKKLLDFAWWEHFLFVTQKYDYHYMSNCVDLYGRLLKHLHALQTAMEKETCQTIHVQVITSLQKDVSSLVNQTIKIYEYLMTTHHHLLPREEQRHLKLQVKQALDRLMEKYVQVLKGILVQTPTKWTQVDLEESMSTSLFLFSLSSFTRQVLAMAQEVKETNQKLFSLQDLWYFVVSYYKPFFTRTSYTWSKFLFATRTSISIILGMVISAFLCHFNDRLPKVIGLVARDHLGGTFNISVNRIIGTVFGSVISSIGQYVICRILGDDVHGNKYEILGDILNGILLILTVTPSIYVYLSGGFSLAAGLVAAYSSAMVLIGKGTKGGLSCPSDLPASIDSLSYWICTETIFGVLILLATELLIQPRSARTLLRQKTQEALEEIETNFTKLFEHHLAKYRWDYIELEQEELQTIQATSLDKILPKLLNEQKTLMTDAALEPSFWRPSFVREKHTEAMQKSEILMDLLWMMTILTSGSQHERGCAFSSFLKQEDTIQLMETQDAFKRTVFGSIDTLKVLYGDKYLNKDIEKSVVFMQLKEAYRRTDVKRHRKLNMEELTLFFMSILPSRLTTLTKEERHFYCGRLADEVMNLASRKQWTSKEFDGHVSFYQLLEIMEQHKCILKWKCPQASRENLLENEEEYKSLSLFEEDLLYVESYTIAEAAFSLKRSFSTSFLQQLSQLSQEDDTTVENVLVNQFMYMSCLLCMTDEVAKRLTQLNRVAISK